MTTLYAPTAAPMAPTPPPLARLARIELRKAVDTRAGRWLLVLIGLVAVTGAAITAVTDPVTAVVLIAADHGQAGLWQGAGRAIGYAFVFQILNLLLGVGFGLLFH
ncbi:MAG TPA: hypothetical protein VGL33_11710, partial [Streptosporangiaceae bacterium]